MQVIPLWVKICYSAFVAVLVPVYWIRYGPANFLWFSDIALLVTFIALWLENRFLVSMMATGVLVFDTVWNYVFFSKLIFGGGAGSLVGYMFDSEISIFIRALSLFHVGLPIVQLWALSKLGYDVRAWKYQALFGGLLFPLTYMLTTPEQNINWAHGLFEAPQPWLPAPLYLASLMISYPILVCFPTHVVLKRLFVK